MIRRLHWAWVILLCSFITVFTAFSIRYSYGILMPEMIMTLKINKAQGGAIASSFFFAYTLFSPLVGFFIDRWSARKLLTYFIFILGSGAFLMGKPISLFQACLFYGIVGVGFSAAWIPTVTLIQRWFGVRQRGKALGILSIGFVTGYGVMGLVLPPLVALFDWRTCWFILSIPAFASAIINGILLRTKPQDLNLKPWGEGSGFHPEISPPEPRQGTRYGDLLKLPNLWLGSLSYCFMAFSGYFINIFVVTYGTMELRFPFARAALLASAIAFSGIAGALFIPILSDSLGRKRCLLLTNISLVFSILLMIGAGKNWPALLLAACIFGVFFAAVWPMYGAVAAEFFPPGTTGSVLGFWTIFYGLALIFGPAGGGYIADRTGTFTWSFLMAAAAGVVGTFFLLTMKRTRDIPR